MASLTKENLSDRERKTKARRDASVVVIPPCEDRERRELLESDDAEWLLYYFGIGCELDDPFWYKFTPHQVEMLEAIRHAIKHGGDQAIAAPRGEGKSTIARRLLLKAILAGEVSYAVLFAASGTMADASIDSMKIDITDNPLIVADYPEVAYPIIALGGSPQRANSQYVSGSRYDNGKVFEQHPSRFSWCGQELIFPDIPGSPSARAIFATRGLDAAVRGLNKRGKRPKLAIVDDPDTEDTSRSEEQAKKLEKRIDGAIGGLGGQQRGIGRVLLTTLQSRIAVSFKFTDPKQKPTFKGKRFRFLVRKPERMDLWEEYIQMRVDDLQSGDVFCRRAHNFYLANRDTMDAGAVIGNQYRFDKTILPDGSQAEASALERYFIEVAKLGADVVATEYDNDPPEDAAIVESGLTPTRIQKQVSGYNRRIVPPGCVVLSQGIDVRKTALHWVVRAWQMDGTGWTIDYGVHEVRGTIYGSDEGQDFAIRRAILERMEATKESGFTLVGSDEQISVAITLIDASWLTDTIYGACLTLGTGIMPVMGFGKSSGCVQANFADIQRRTDDKKPGDNWFLSRKQKTWLVCANADHWKAWEHNRWLTTPGKPGAMQVFGLESERPDRLSDDQKSHHSYARHICNESEVEEMSKGTLRRVFKAKSDNTHWLDASYYADVGASMKGVKLITSASAFVNKEQRPRVNLSDMAKQRR
jgi:hypothetical protein